MHSLSDDNNLVPFHLKWEKLVLKHEKTTKFCPGLSQNIPFSFYFFKNAQKLQIGQVFVENNKTFS